MKFSFYHVLLFIGVAEGLFLILTLSNIKDKNYSANRFLSLFIFVLVFLLGLQIASNFPVLKIVTAKLGYLADGIIFFYGPSLFLYCQAMLSEVEDRWHMHFIPLVIFLICNIFFNYYGLYDDPNMSNMFYLSIASTSFLHIFYYIIKSYRYCMDYLESSKQFISYRPDVKYLMVIIFFVGFSITLFLVDFVYAEIFEDKLLSFLNYEITWLMISLLTFVLGYYAIIQPEIFRLPVRQKISDPASHIDLEKIKSELVSSMKTDELFLDPELTLDGLANHIGLSKTVISKAINSGFGKNFYDFVNEFRIKQFMDLAMQRDSDKYTHLGLAWESGFKSKTTFYKAFRRLNQTTPADYFKALPQT